MSAPSPREIEAALVAFYLTHREMMETDEGERHDVSDELYRAAHDLLSNSASESSKTHRRRSLSCALR